MKHRIALGSLIPVLLVLLTGAPIVSAVPSSTTGEKTTLTIKGMTCGGCVATVKLKIKRTVGVTAYEISLERGEAVVQAGAQPGQDVYCLVSGAVFQIKNSSLRADVHGKTVYFCCANCARYFAQNRDRVLDLRGLSL